MAKNANHTFRKVLKIQDKVALSITNVVGTMYCVYAFCALAFVALPQAIASHSLTVLVNWISSNFLQLILLPLLMVGQNLQSKHSEIRAEHDYETNVKAEKETRQIIETLTRIEGKVNETPTN